MNTSRIPILVPKSRLILGDTRIPYLRQSVDPKLKRKSSYLSAVLDDPNPELSANLDANGYKIVSLGAPTSSNDAARFTDITREFFVPCFSGTGLLTSYYGGYTSMRCAATDWVDFSFHVPDNFVSLTNVKIIMIARTTGSYDYTADVKFGANGEPYNQHTDSSTSDGISVTDGYITERLITTAFDGLAANDNVGVQFTIDALTTTLYMYVLGLNFKYS
jgi:hypothetical protein